MSETQQAPQTECEESDQTTVRDLEIRLTKLEGKVEQVIQPTVLDDVPEVQRELAEAKREIEQLRDELARTKQKVEDMVGVPEEAASTHDKRVKDTRQILYRRAEANDGRSSMYWREIRDSLAEHGHGNLEWEQINRIMQALDDIEGFELTDGQRDVAAPDDRTDIREVAVVECNQAVLMESDAAQSFVGGEVPDGGSDTTKPR